jgi:hypothetical protein
MIVVSWRAVRCGFGGWQPGRSMVRCCLGGKRIRLSISEMFTWNSKQNKSEESDLKVCLSIETNSRLPRAHDITKVT